MPIEPSITVSISADGKTATIEDVTDYTSEPLNTFDTRVITLRLFGSDDNITTDDNVSEPSNPTVDNIAVFGSLSDEVYVATITLEKSPDTFTFSLPFIINVDIQKCVAKDVLSISKKCDCKDTELGGVIEKYLGMKGMEFGVQFAQYSGAQELVRDVTALCNDKCSC